MGRRRPQAAHPGAMSAARYAITAVDKPGSKARKVCTKCRVEKELSEFGCRSDTKSKLRSACRSCAVASAAAWKAANKERAAANLKAWRKANRDKTLASKRAWNKAHPESARQHKRTSYLKLKAAGRSQQKSKEYRAKNRSACDKRAADWKKANPERSRELARIWHGKKYANDPLHRFKECVRARTRSAFKTKTARRSIRSAGTRELLGCSFEFAKAYIEARFKPGMSWANQGKWHIDHIRPCVSFDLSDPEQQRQCFHYSNLQPLWWHENIKKSDTLPGPHQACLL